MTSPDKPSIGGKPATVHKKLWWLNLDGRDPIMGRTRVVKDPGIDVSTQGNGIDEALENLREATELDQKLNPQKYQQ